MSTDAQKAKPYLYAGTPMLGIGLAFAAVGLSGQPAFSYIAVGLLIPGAVLVLGGVLSRLRRR
ncbi:hypothetical protein D3C76_471160 [compost metagenome]